MLHFYIYGIIIRKNPCIRRHSMKKILSTLLAVLLVVLASLFGLTGGEEAPEVTLPQLIQQEEVIPEAEIPEAESAVPETEAQPQAPPETVALIDESGYYTTKEDVALYIHTYGCLPDNFVTKAEAEDAGWSGGSVEKYIPGAAIGGNRFGNREGLLPDAPGRTWTECDINTNGASGRGAERIVFSNDGLIYYTSDHYESFEVLYE